MGLGVSVYSVVFGSSPFALGNRGLFRLYRGLALPGHSCFSDYDGASTTSVFVKILD